MIRPIAALTLAVVLLPAGSAGAQAWTRDQGSTYLSLNHRLISADDYYAPNGEKTPLARTFTQHSLSFYGEVGVIDRWLTLSLQGELFRKNILDEAGATSGLGDLRVGAFTGLVTDPLRLSVGVLVGIPTGDDEPSAGADADGFARATAALLPTGDGEVDTAFVVALGRSFGGGGYPFWHYATANVGYWLRGEEITDAITWGLEFGTSPAAPGWDRLSLALRLLGVEPLETSEMGVRFSGLGDGVSYTSVGAELSVRTVDALRVGLGYETAIAATSLPAAAAFKFLLSWER